MTTTAVGLEHIIGCLTSTKQQIPHGKHPAWCYKKLPLLRSTRVFGSTVCPKELSFYPRWPQSPQNFCSKTKKIPKSTVRENITSKTNNQQNQPNQTSQCVSRHWKCSHTLFLQPFPGLMNAELIQPPVQVFRSSHVVTKENRQEENCRWNPDLTCPVLPGRDSNSLEGTVFVALRLRGRFY